MFGQSDDILRPLAQRRHAKLKLAETMEEILAEAALGHGGVEILIRGSDNAHIDFDLAVAAKAVEGISIKHAQELHLGLELQFADFIEEERTLVGEFEQTCARGI